MYPFERFTERAKSALTLAQKESERLRHSYIGTEHLLLGLLGEPEGLAARVLGNLGIEIEVVRSTIESVLGRNDQPIMQHILPTSRVKRVIELAFEEARQEGTNHVGTEHLLLALLIEGEGIAAHVLEDLGATLGTVRAELERLRGEGTEEDPQSATSPHGPLFSTGSRVGADPLWTLAGRAARLADEQQTSVGPEHILLALLDSGPLVARMLAALGIDEARVAEARRIVTPPAALLEMRAAWRARSSEGMSQRSAQPDLDRLRAELDVAERRWRSGEAPGGEAPAGGSS